MDTILCIYSAPRKIKIKTSLYSLENEAFQTLDSPFWAGFVGSQGIPLPGSAWFPQAPVVGGLFCTFANASRCFWDKEGVRKGAGPAKNWWAPKPLQLLEMGMIWASQPTLSPIHANISSTLADMSTWGWDMAVTPLLPDGN